MDYKSLMGYGKKNKVTKKQSKLKVNKVLEDIKEELNESRTMLGVQTMKDNPPFQTQKQLKEVGAAAEYRKLMKDVDRNYTKYWDSVKAFEDKLVKKGMKTQAKFLHKQYVKSVLGFKVWFKGWIDRLL